MEDCKVLSFILIACALFCTSSYGLPVLDSSEINEKSEKNSDESSGSGDGAVEVLPDGFAGLNFTATNGTAKNLYVVKAVVYEIGIITEINENDTSSEETHERVDLTFFDAHTNESHIDLGNIPLPVQTNVSGQVLTGIAPVNIGAFSNPSELLESLPLTGTIVNITHSDTAFFKLTAKEASEEDGPHVLSPEDFSKIPQVADVFPEIVPTKDESSEEDTKDNKGTDNSI